MIKIVIRKFEDEWTPLNKKEEREFVDEVLDEIFKEHGLNVSIKYVRTPKYLREGRVRTE